jgi:non-canonical purine NTP pyrophosphatase (RdgB/HAM1 family)
MNKLKLKDIVIITSNENKLSEINRILGTDHKVSTVNIPEIQSLNLDEVISAKAKAAYEKIKKPVLVTDVSLEIEALDGLPGPFVKFFLKTLGAEKTVALIKGKNTKTKVTDAIAIYDGKTLKIFKGEVYGHLVDKERGTNGFGFDFVFVPDGFKKTYSQLSPEEKNKISHRALALKKLKKYLET